MHTPKVVEHILYTKDDFTEEEIARENRLAVVVIKEGRRICKICGRTDEELLERCGARRYGGVRK